MAAKQITTKNRSVVLDCLADSAVDRSSSSSKGGGGGGGGSGGSGSGSSSGSGSGSGSSSSSSSSNGAVLDDADNENSHAYAQSFHDDNQQTTWVDFQHSAVRSRQWRNKQQQQHEQQQHEQQQPSSNSSKSVSPGNWPSFLFVRVHQWKVSQDNIIVHVIHVLL